MMAGEAIVGATIFRDIMAGVRDPVGGRSATCERALRDARAIALEDLRQPAKALGANAVVGVDLDYAPRDHTIQYSALDGRSGPAVPCCRDPTGPGAGKEPR